MIATVTLSKNGLLAPDTAPAIGHAVKELRWARQWTQDDLARESGVSSSAISLIERGLRTPERETLDRLAVGLGEQGDALVIRAGLLPAWIVVALDAGTITAEDVSWALSALHDRASS